ncbi:Glutaminyl-tRNA synthetase [Hanseniaspora vineae]
MTTTTSNNTPSVDQLTESFSKIGFEDGKIKEILKNNKLSVILLELIQLSDKTASTESFGKIERGLVHNLASSINKSKNVGAEDIPKFKIVVDYILDGKLKTNLQVEAAFKYVADDLSKTTNETFDQYCGVGVVVTEDQIRSRVMDYVQQHLDEIKEKRYVIVPALFANIKALPELKWAEPRYFKPIIDAEILKVLGPKDERDFVKKEKKKTTNNSNKNGEKKDNKNGNSSGALHKERNMFAEGFLGDLHKVGENPQAYPELMEEHLKVTQGKVRTRFPPEPNGYLHIGHSKAIMVNFGYAKYHNGVCYLRFDDTNPEAEAPEYFESIKSMVSWLGFKPWKITYSSDYFDELYALAEVLIKNGKAYVCHCTAEDIKRSRGIKEDGTPGGERKACVHRSQTVEETLSKFRDMRDGKYQPGEATLRMKQNLESPSPQMWDLIAYRVLNAPHPRTGTKWKIYPTYDFTHCLVDSFENITHSLCTTEFYLSRESYEWLCDQVHVFRPAQREYGRLNITGTVLSKRKIAKLVNGGYVRGWNDPRLFTLEAIRRRGVPPGAILSFINTLGVTTSTTNIQVVRFESAIRKYLEDTTPRLMFVQDPILIEIENLDDDFELDCSIPYRPGCPEFGERIVKFTNKVYIERSDFSNNADDKEFFRLTPNQPVGLIRVPHNLIFKSLETDPKDPSKITKIVCHYDVEKATKKPKTYIQWVPVATGIKVHETRIYNQLFKSENPLSVENYLDDLNPESEVVLTNSVIEPNFREVVAKSPWVMEAVKKSEFYVEEADPTRKEVVRFQAMRCGYFCLDSDSTDDKIVLNRIVSLKDGSK